LGFDPQDKASEVKRSQEQVLIVAMGSGGSPDAPFHYGWPQAWEMLSGKRTGREGPELRAHYNF